MTQDKAFKAAVRARMAQAGEPYSVARRALLSESDDEGERVGHGAISDPMPAGDQAEDFNARYAREAASAGVPEAELQADLELMAAEDTADQARFAADLAQQAADRAQDVADEAEEAAERAEERAELAQQAADLAEEWADPDEQEQARHRADTMRERADQARQQADRAQEAAERAQERADLAEQAADMADEDEFEDEPGERPGSFAGRPPRVPRPPGPPRPPMPHRTRGPERFIQRLDELQRRVREATERASAFLEELNPERDKH